MCNGQNTIIFRLHDDGQRLYRQIGSDVHRLRMKVEQRRAAVERMGLLVARTAARLKNQPMRSMEIAIYARLIADSKE